MEASSICKPGERAAPGFGLCRSAAVSQPQLNELMLPLVAVGIANVKRTERLAAVTDEQLPPLADFPFSTAVLRCVEDVVQSEPRSRRKAETSRPARSSPLASAYRAFNSTRAARARSSGASRLRAVWPVWSVPAPRRAPRRGSKGSATGEVLPDVTESFSPAVVPTATCGSLLGAQPAKTSSTRRAGQAV